jgi:ribosomal protein S18 acetylase RimI-like enzyme
MAPVNVDIESRSGKDNADIEIYPTRSTVREQIVRLYKEAGWWLPENDRQPEFVDKIAANSYCFMGAFDGRRMIGMGRVLSDGVSDAYIQDVTVLREYRGRGLGAMIIEKLVLKLRTDRISWIGLIGEPGTGDFYRKLGFTKMQGSVPFTYKG